MIYVASLSPGVVFADFHGEGASEAVLVVVSYSARFAPTLKLDVHFEPTS